MKTDKMKTVESFGCHGDAFAAKIQQHTEHGKFCVQVNRNGEPAEWFGWCEYLSIAQEWVNGRSQ